MVAKGKQVSLALGNVLEASIYLLIVVSRIYLGKVFGPRLRLCKFFDIYKVCLSAIHSSLAHYSQEESSLGWVSWYTPLQYTTVQYSTVHYSTVDPTTVQDVSRIFK